jgi:4a-hydroxytetrahydrobiopterin dehydratase
VNDDPKQILSGHDVEAERLLDWRILFGALHARFRTGSFATGLDLVNRIGAAAEEMNHHPDVDLRYPHVDVRLTSHDAGGVTRRDVDLARQISGFAEVVGADADPGAVQVLEIGLDTADHEAIKPFWAAVLGLRASEDRDDELNDPAGRLPTLWFQQTEPHEEPRQRFHLDIRVPPEVAESRVQAAVKAGGTLVSDERAPTFWVLADAQGNKCCVTTWLGRQA